MDRSGVDYCDIFISFLDTHSDGTHSLQWVRGVYIFSKFSFLGWTIPLNMTNSIKNYCNWAPLQYHPNQTTNKC